MNLYFDWSMEQGICRIACGLILCILAYQLVFNEYSFSLLPNFGILEKYIGWMLKAYLTKYLIQELWCFVPIKADQ